MEPLAQALRQHAPVKDCVVAHQSVQLPKYSRSGSPLAAPSLAAPLDVVLLELLFALLPEPLLALLALLGSLAASALLEAALFVRDPAFAELVPSLAAAALVETVPSGPRVPVPSAWLEAAALARLVG